MQAGDVLCGEHVLRLTMGALAEIEITAGASGPAAIAEIFRRGNSDKIDAILTAVLRPCQPDAQTVSKALDRVEARQALAQLFERQLGAFAA